MGWSHGYFWRGSYTSGYYRELAPNWLDFAALVKGQRPPRSVEGEPFRFLELGSGMGFSLCLLASLYPEGRFTGVDFQPDHIAHSQQLANELGLTNIRFMEADFLSLQADPTPLGFHAGEPGRFDYVVTHGTATWVTRPVQEALLAVAAASLRTAGLMYCSYNTLPGWQPLSLFQHLADLEAERNDPAQPGLAFQRAASTLTALLGTPELPTPLAMQFPSLRRELLDIPLNELNYLCQEYANAGWQPLHVAHMHRRAESHKLTPIATATLPELFDELLPEPLRDMVLQEENPVIRQTMLDLLTAKGFRRDIFCRGRSCLSQAQWEQRIGALRVRAAETPPLEHYRFSTSFGEASGDAAAYFGLERAIAAESQPLAKLCVSTGLPLVEVVRMVSLLLDAGRVGLDRGEAGLKARAACVAANELLRLRMQQGWPYSTLAAPGIGNGLSFNIVEATLLQGHGRGLRGDDLVMTSLQRLQALGVSLTASGKQPIQAEADQLRRLWELAGDLLESRVPRLTALGVLKSGPARGSEPQHDVLDLEVSR